MNQINYSPIFAYDKYISNNFAGVLDRKLDTRPYFLFEDWKKKPTIDSLCKNRIYDGKCVKRVILPYLGKLQNFDQVQQRSFGFISKNGKTVPITGDENLIEYVREKMNGVEISVVTVGKINYMLHDGYCFETDAIVGSYEKVGDKIYNNDHNVSTQLIVGKVTYQTIIRPWYRFDELYIDNDSEGFVVYMKGFFFKFKTFWTIDMSHQALRERGIHLLYYEGIREYSLPRLLYKRDRPDKEISDNPVQLLNSRGLSYYERYLADRPSKCQLDDQHKGYDFIEDVEIQRKGLVVPQFNISDDKQIKPKIVGTNFRQKKKSI